MSFPRRQESSLPRSRETADERRCTQTEKAVVGCAVHTASLFSWQTRIDAGFTRIRAINNPSLSIQKACHLSLVASHGLSPSISPSASTSRVKQGVSHAPCVTGRPSCSCLDQWLNHRMPRRPGFSAKQGGERCKTSFSSRVRLPQPYNVIESRSGNGLAVWTE